MCWFTCGVLWVLESILILLEQLKKSYQNVLSIHEKYEMLGEILMGNDVDG